jgi:hypothetical protein
MPNIKYVLKEQISNRFSRVNDSGFDKGTEYITPLALKMCFFDRDSNRIDRTIAQIRTGHGCVDHMTNESGKKREQQVSDSY